MKKTLLCIACGLLLLSSFAQVKKPVAGAKPPAAAAKPAAKTGTAATVNPFKSNIDSVSYAVGLLVAQNLKAQGFDNVNLVLFQKALNDVKANKTPLLTETAVRQCVTDFQQKVNGVKDAAAQKENAAKSIANRQEGQTFLANNGKRTGVTTTASGLQYEVIKAGTDNTRPTLASQVKCHYRGTLLNGFEFDGSIGRGEPITFPLGNVIKGWQEALQLMTVGSKWKLYIPADLAYGDNAPPAIGPGATLIFEVELLAITN